MSGSDRPKKGELFIVDNSDNAWNVKKYLAEWCQLSNKFDIATGFFEIGSAALVGSSNFTLPGITENVELNVQIKHEIETLQEWFEQRWKEAEDVTPEILKTVERHTKEYTPFDVYTKALYEYFKGHELTASEWELKESKVYPILDQYQKEGYHALMKAIYYPSAYYNKKGAI